ncbi:hypothetical protein C8T65DRAFT_832374 [Cerioporus squamosus]|nr:hypothetical protein C8T65DRAFT_832374 [Cerioporus squamosus]
MSSAADAAAATAALFNTLYTEDYCDVSASVLFIHDTFCTFNREVACFWSAKRTGASLLFFANKWISMALYVMFLVSLASFPSDKSSEYRKLIVDDRSCSSFQIVYEAVNVLQLVPAAITVASRVPLIFADIVLIYITWTKLSCRSAPVRDTRHSMSLASVLFRDGTIYFVVLSVLNLLHLVLSVTALGITGDGASYATNFTGPLTAILVSRFLLDLQEANRMVVRGVDPDDPLHSSSDAPSFISSLGAFINPDFPASSDDELELDDVSCPNREEEGGAQVSKFQAASPSSVSA